MTAFTPIPTQAATPLEYYPTCPDCGSAAAGRGYFGKPCCGLCERSISDDLRLGNLRFTAVEVSDDRLQVRA
jgi:hypothetical protein